MPLYNESRETVTKEIVTFDRAYRVTINYPNKGTPSIKFEEEKIRRVDGQDSSMGRLGSLEEVLTEENIDEEYDLISPVDGSKIGTAKYGDVQALLYSLYFYLATKRDNK